jgi:site-specific DNA-methyltransferase (cytosine-N4-specific)
MSSHYNLIIEKIDTTPYYKTNLGTAYLSDSLDILKKIPSNSVKLIMTSPPFALVRKKKYDNVDANEYLTWFSPFAIEFKRILKRNGSLVLHLGGSWIKGIPSKSLYNFKVLIYLCEELGFYLSQDFYWYNKAKLPGPAEWTNVRRIRIKDAVEPIWWLSKVPYPYANNKYVLNEYSDEMKKLLLNDNYYKSGVVRPSEHTITKKFYKDNKGSIPPNFFNYANTDSNSIYMRGCRDNNIKSHPSKFPEELPEFFIKFLTKEKDVVLDPFAGSNTTGSMAEKNNRNWVSVEILKDYLEASKYRFQQTFDTKI